MTSNIIDSHAHREAWLSTVHQMITMCMELETDLSIAMLERPTGEQALNIIAADAQLGAAVAALGEAAARVGRLHA